jgi:hypothetical protein
MPKTGAEDQTGLYSVVNFENSYEETLSFTMQIMTEKGGEPDSSVLVCIGNKDDEDGVSISVPVDVLGAMFKRLTGEI